MLQFIAISYPYVLYNKLLINSLEVGQDLFTHFSVGATCLLVTGPRIVIKCHYRACLLDMKKYSVLVTESTRETFTLPSLTKAFNDVKSTNFWLEKSDQENPDRHSTVQYVLLADSEMV